MDIYLRVETGGYRAEHLGDVRLRVEPSHTVAAVAAALGTYFAVERPMIGRPTLGPLDSALTMSAVGLLTGETLVLGACRSHRSAGGGGRELIVASGPDVGLRCELVGRQLTVGRDPGCEFTLNDPQMSRRQLQIVTGPDGTLQVEPLAPGNLARVHGRALERTRTLLHGEVILAGSSSLVIRTPNQPRASASDGFGQIPFHRTPYFHSPVAPITVEAIADIPSTPDPPRFAYLSAVLPLVIGLGFAFLFGPRYLLFALFSPVMLIGAYIEQRRRTGRGFIKSVERFDEALEAKRAEVAAALAVERTRRFDAAPDVAALADRAAGRTADLWVRDRLAADFLALRVGLGEVKTTLQVLSGIGGDDAHREQIDERLGQTERMADVPVALPLAELGVVALVGRDGETTALASSLVVQATCLHSPEDLVLLAAVSPERAITDWAKWSPHTRSSGSPIAGPHLVSATDHADLLVTELVNEASRRLSAATSGTRRFPWLLVVLDRALEPDAAMVSRLLDVCPAAGMSVLWLSDSRQRVPRQAQAVVECRPSTSNTQSLVSYTDPDLADQPIDLERVGREFAEETGRALAPLRDASSSDAATAIPRVVPLFTGLGIVSVDAGWVAQQWQVDRGYSLPAPIGFIESGPLVLDMVTHGPHGLIGGTSGAGKSELVMSMVAGLIALHPPTAVNFLFIDYKGGASSQLFAEVPHTVGYVTNLDGQLSKRALTSLRAELNRRMTLLEGKAKDLAELIERFPDEAPPSLVIVVDEFATLVKEVPEFVAGIVDIAQRGRSLGIHLLLATQRPSGSIHDNITANTNLRLSLRMLDGAESSAVIGSPAAASIPLPLKGRGYIKIGTGEPVAFQSSWAGAPLLAESGTPPVTVAPFGHSLTDTPCDQVSGMAGPAGIAGNALPVEHQAAAAGQQRTQVDALLQAVAEATDQLGHQQGRPPWLEMLPPVIGLDLVRAEAGPAGERRPGTQIVFGMIDDPAAQAQYPAVLDLARSGGLIISGTGGSGKSTLLKTIALSAAMDDADAGGGELSVFAIDFASRELGGLRHLRQCGGVATADDLEAVTRLIEVLYLELERRRQTQADAVARAEAPPDNPSVLLLIDGIDVVVQTMEQAGAGGLARYHDMLTKLVSDGRQVAIYPIISSARRAAIRSTMTSAISDRLTLRQADVQGYVDCGLGTADAADVDLSPGQGFFNGSNLLQVATLTDTSPGQPRLAEIVTGEETGRHREQEERQRLVAVAAALVGEVAPDLRSSPLPPAVALLPSIDPLQPVVGLSDISDAPYALDLRHDDVSVVGDPRSGRSTVLATMGRQAARSGAEVWVIGRRGSPLENLDEVTNACFDDGETLVRHVEALARLATEPATASAARLLLLDDHDLRPEHCRELTSALEQLLTSVRFVAAGPTPKGFRPDPVAQRIRSCRSIVYLRPHDARDASEVTGVPVPWRPGVAMVEGRGYVVVDRNPTLVQFSDPFLDQP